MTKELIRFSSKLFIYSCKTKLVQPSFLRHCQNFVGNLTSHSREIRQYYWGDWWLDGYLLYLPSIQPLDADRRHTNLEAQRRRGAELLGGILRLKYIILLERTGDRERLNSLLGTPFHADSNELYFVSVALILTEILVDCNRT